MKDQEHLRQWLAAHPFISVSAISQAMGCNRRVLGEKLSGHRKQLTEEEMDKVASLLKKYGYPEK